MKASPHLTASSIGGIAAAVLDQGGEADVIAAFERSAYVMLAHGIVCLGAPVLGRGPIHLLVETRGAGPEPTFLGLGVGMKGIAGRRRLTLGADLDIATQGAPVWTPPPFPPFERATTARGVAALAAAMPARVPSDGLAALVFAPDAAAARTPTARAARDSLAALRTGVPGALQRRAWTDDDRRAATLLVGLGPGLTPSGDDLLGGLLLALSARGETALRDALWHALAAEVDDLTVPPSAMHLSAAADGMGTEVVHALIDALLRGDASAMTTALPPVLGLGATSGADLVAGLAIGLAG
jgi:hypothetical protein